MLYRWLLSLVINLIAIAFILFFMLLVVFVVHGTVSDFVGTKYENGAKAIRTAVNEMYKALPSPIVEMYNVVLQKDLNSYLLVDHQTTAMTAVIERKEEAEYTKGAINQVKDSIKSRLVSSFDLTTIQLDIQKAGWYSASKSFDGSQTIAVRLKSLGKRMDDIKDPVASWNAYRRHSLNNMISESKYFVLLFKEGDKDALASLQDLLKHANDTLTVERRELTSIIRKFKDVSEGLSEVMDILADQQRKQESKWLKSYKTELASFGQQLVNIISRCSVQIDSLLNEEMQVKELLKSINFKRGGILEGKRIKYAIHELVKEIDSAEKHKMIESVPASQ